MSNKYAFLQSDRSWSETLTLLANVKLLGPMGGPIDRVGIAGISRSGKSTWPTKMFELCERVPCHEGMQIDDLCGGFDPRAVGQGKSMAAWCHGPGTRMMLEGGTLVLDEIDLHSPEVRPVLHAVLDKPSGIILANGEHVRAKKGFTVFATTNLECPDQLAEPIYERLQAWFVADTLSEGLVASLGRFGKLAVRNAESRAERYRKWQRPMGTGLLLACASLHEAGVPPDCLPRALGLRGQQANDLAIALSE